MILAWLAGCISEADEIALAWNVIFEVEAMAEDPGCEPAVTEAEPADPFVGIGYGRGNPDTVSIYWCISTEECAPVPWATFWVDRSTLTKLEGQSGQVSLTNEQLCTVSWAGAVGKLDDERVEIDVQLFSGAPVLVENGAECDAILQSVIGASCDLSRHLEGPIAP